MTAQRGKLPCSMENPDNYLHVNIFDLIIKIVDMHFHVVIKHIPQCILLSHTEHLRVWNGFKEFCDDKDPRMNDYYKLCKPKNSTEDFLASYHNLIDNLRNYGFNPSKSSIPVDVNGFLINGAHRLASSIVLSQLVFIQQMGQKHAQHNKKQGPHSLFLQTGILPSSSCVSIKNYNFTSQIYIEWCRLCCFMGYSEIASWCGFPPH